MIRAGMTPKVAAMAAAEEEEEEEAVRVDDASGGGWLKTGFRPLVTRNEAGATGTVRVAAARGAGVGGEASGTGSALGDERAQSEDTTLPNATLPTAVSLPRTSGSSVGWDSSGGGGLVGVARGAIAGGPGPGAGAGMGAIAVAGGVDASRAAEGRAWVAGPSLPAAGINSSSSNSSSGMADVAGVTGGGAPGLAGTLARAALVNSRDGGGMASTAGVSNTAPPTRTVGGVAGVVIGASPELEMSREVVRGDVVPVVTAGGRTASSVAAIGKRFDGAGGDNVDEEKHSDDVEIVHAGLPPGNEWKEDEEDHVEVSTMNRRHVYGGVVGGGGGHRRACRRPTSWILFCHTCSWRVF